MFKFDFDIEDIDEDIQETIQTSLAQKAPEDATYTQVSFQEHLISDLVRRFTHFCRFMG
jgi:hypothetical protein